MCDVGGEVRVFVGLLKVSGVNVSLSWTCELIQVDGFIVVVNDHNVWLLYSHTELTNKCLNIFIQTNLARKKN